MTVNETVGLIIAAVVVVAGFVGIIIKLLKPINDLNINIVRLTAAIERLVENDKVQDNRINKHGQEIDKLSLKWENHEQRLINLEGK